MNLYKSAQFRLMIILFVLCIQLNSSYADEQHKIIYFGLAGDMFSQLIDQKPVGIIAQSMDYVLQQMGYTVHYILLSSDVMKESIQEGELDVAASMPNYSNSNEKIFWMTDTIFREYNILFVKYGKGFPVTNHASLYDKKIGGKHGCTYSLIEGDSQIQIERVHTDAENIRNLLLGKLDVVIAGAVTAYYLRLEGLIRDLEVLDRSVGYVDFGGALSKKRFAKEDVSRFNNLLLQLKQEPQWQKILNSNSASNLVKQWPLIQE
ncbi:MAG: transporter substrate-binding domain-containing protein [Desulfobacterales bacterium]|nr:transporter substrate-binding domain-containing protein [Desulfobacterales bacterium]